MTAIAINPVGYGWQRAEEPDEHDGRLVSVRWERGAGLDFELENGTPNASTLEVDPGVSLAEVAAALAAEVGRPGTAVPLTNSDLPRRDAALRLLEGWQRFEEEHGRVAVVRWARGADDTEPGVDFIIEPGGIPVAAALEVDRGVSLEEVAAIVAIEAQRGPQS